ncbi:hypothetical protein BpHYR1_003578 [Brachionus plicatilis]|uniref:Uncharacterized protein n=1 Tax=Brachionus plicatilis TaxID=10195 RepID=A0A3M7SYE3_BRAPC|nr:hypothetical protein BpHYR1_003578 [Brachionus plicatilis]
MFKPVLHNQKKNYKAFTFCTTLKIKEIVVPLFTIRILSSVNHTYPLILSRIYAMIIFFQARYRKTNK